MGKRIVIVGGGATAVSAMAHIVRISGVESVTFVAPRSVGLGTAFGTTDPALLCNTSVDVTSLVAEGESDLLAYLAARGHAVHADDFVPRYMVGQYCRERFNRYVREARRAGIRVTHLGDRAVAVDRLADWNYRVVLHSGASVTGTAVLLCHGADVPILPAEVRQYSRHPRLIAAAHPSQRLRELPSQSRVLVIGTKLSAIDAALILGRDAQRHTVLTSPSGVLPSVRNRLRRMPSPGFEEDVWADLDPDDERLGRILARQLLAAVRSLQPGTPASRPRTTGEAAEILYEEIRLATASQVPWQDIVAELIDVINEYASRWDADARSAVLGRYKALMSRYISAIPLHNASLLAGYLSDGRLRIAPRYLRSIGPHGSGWTVEWPDGSRESFDYMVCAAGYEALPMRCPPDGLHIGHGSDGSAPEVLEDLRVRFAPEDPAERIWALGACAGTRYPIVNYLRAAAQHSAIVAAQLAEDSVEDLELRVERTSL
ncbi:FAD/NAD(P)-binding protein [Streptomyces sp. WMMB 322]|uniref:FAD/NAD(P)-binding protein n=1 Tax=Streptomyces sp. WMMB 322 TaxID=1286821 RepID=UPI000823ECE6|nr:FAD/NAD(P)-binding protein [Streptomyces sp. WMMB 322]SCK09782.1 FAD-NAD(P)-binding [Streptomyces sp. WMMB 322]